MPGKRAGLPAAFLTKLDDICGRMNAKGHPTRIAWGVRTLDQQVQIYARGRSFAQFTKGLINGVTKGHIGKGHAQKWIDHYDPKVGKNPMPTGWKTPTTWTLNSRHIGGKAADVIHPKLGWGAPPAFWKALKVTAQAEGLQIGPPATDLAHVEVP